MQKFSGFLERKDRQNKDNLRTLGKLLKKSGFNVHDHLDHHGDAYLYVEKPLDNDPIIENLEFGGIRIYTRGREIISFRPQNKEHAEPFGSAYLLDVKGMYKDLMKDSNNDKVGKDVAKYIVEEILNFFLYCAKAQQDEEQDTTEDGLGKVINNSSTGMDYGSKLSGDRM